MMIRAIGIRVVDNNTTIKKNQYLAERDMMRYKPNRFVLGMDTLVLEGPGAWQLERYFEKSGIEEILSLELENGDTCHNVLDDLCLYGTIHIDIEIADKGWVCNMTLTFIKNVEEGKKNLAEFYVPKIE